MIKTTTAVIRIDDESYTLSGLTLVDGVPNLALSPVGSECTAITFVTLAEALELEIVPAEVAIAEQDAERSIKGEYPN